MSRRLRVSAHYMRALEVEAGARLSPRAMPGRGGGSSGSRADAQALLRRAIPLLLTFICLFATGCRSSHDPPRGPISLEALRSCMPVAEPALPVTPTLRTLLSEAVGGALRTPPPDPTFTGSLAAYVLLFSDNATARNAQSAGRQAVAEFQDKFPPRAPRRQRYGTTRVNRNALILYLVNPATSGAAGAQHQFERCLANA
jgi:hypothetical protein